MAKLTLSWPGRNEGKKVAGLPIGQQFMPFMVTRRCEAVNQFSYDIDVSELEKFIGQHNQKNAMGITAFGMVLRALALSFHQFPELNRFVSGRRIYQRHTVDITFSGRLANQHNAGVFLRKRRFLADEPLSKLCRSLNKEIKQGRSGAKEDPEKQLRWLVKLPWPMAGIILSAVRLLDQLNLLPAKMIEKDPFYASCFVANLGSLGIDSAYHCMYEHGTIPLVVSVGRIRSGRNKDGDATRIMNISYSYDGRAGDGWECARFVQRVKDLLECPHFMDDTHTNLHQGAGHEWGAEHDTYQSKAASFTNTATDEANA